ncbi:MAG: hypothetical protein V2A55_01900 [Candidatus Jorgensenbacteria bacterium]
MDKKNAGIVAFAFGAPADIPSNRCLARIAEKASRTFDAPIFTQRDIRFLPGAVDAEYVEEDLDHPPPTLRIARSAVDWVIRRKIGDLFVVAATPHLDRCLRDTKVAVAERGSAGEGITVFPVDPDAFGEGDGPWFCPESAQPRTRSSKAWWRREGVVRRMPPHIYRLVAS